VEPDPKRFWMNGAGAGAGAKNFWTVEPKPEPDIRFPVPQPWFMLRINWTYQTFLHMSHFITIHQIYHFGRRPLCRCNNTIVKNNTLFFNFHWTKLLDPEPKTLDA